jgi:carboxypeptidase C (cathepsin A)
MLYEVGAFKFLTPGVPSFNVTPLAWNMKANLLFMETPGAVGFSTGPTNSSDDEATYDHLLALTAFLARFPTQRKNDLYLAGHGYAGILAPMLGKAISIRNQNPFYLKINFKGNSRCYLGLLLGNPCTDPSECYVGKNYKNSAAHYEYLFNHAFMTDQHWNQFRGACSIGYDSDICASRRQQIDKLFDSTNSSAYNIYEKCYKAAGNPICEDESAILTVLNDDGFQTALHVTNGNFSVCNQNVSDNYVGNPQGSYSIIKELLAAKKYKIVRCFVNLVRLLWRSLQRRSIGRY